jgi:selenocysteine lyase/cysteine desulfurase
MERLSEHVSALTATLLEQLGSLRHRNGEPLVKIYGPANTIDRGGTVAFNACDSEGAPMPYALVETRARQAGVSLRGGCFCNPGASESAFGLEPERTGDCLENLGATFTPERFAACTGTAAGAVRASLGLANNGDDIHRAVDVVASFGS